MHVITECSTLLSITGAFKLIVNHSAYLMGANTPQSSCVYHTEYETEKAKERAVRWDQENIYIHVKGKVNIISKELHVPLTTIDNITY